MIHPLETIKRVPWEVWVGLGLTVLVGWYLTRQTLQAGETAAMQGVVAAGAGTGPGTDTGTVQALGQYQQEVMQSIQIANKQTLDAVNAANGQTQQSLADIGGNVTGIATRQSDIVASQQAIAGQLSGVSGDTAAIQTQLGQEQTSLTGLGALLASLQQQLAHLPAYQVVQQTSGGGSPTQPSSSSAGGSGPGGRNDTQAQVNADIGTHSATTASGQTYTIGKSYANMTPQEKDDANRYAHGYSG